MEDILCETLCWKQKHVFKSLLTIQHQLYKILISSPVINVEMIVKYYSQSFLYFLSVIPNNTTLVCICTWSSCYKPLNQYILFDIMSILLRCRGNCCSLFLLLFCFFVVFYTIIISDLKLHKSLTLVKNQAFAMIEKCL